MLALVESLLLISSAGNNKQVKGDQLGFALTRKIDTPDSSYSNFAAGVLQKGNEAFKKFIWRRGAAANVQVDGHHIRHSTGDGVTIREYAAIDGAIADRDHPFWLRCGAVGPLQCLAHVLGNWSGHQKHVGVTRRGDKAQAEALQIVERIVEGMNLKFAAVAGAGVDFADREAATESPTRRAFDARRQFGKRCVVGRRRRFSEGSVHEVFEQRSAH